MSDLVIATEPPTKRRASGDAGERGLERGRSPGLSLIFWLLEQRDSTPFRPICAATRVRSGGTRFAQEKGM